MFGTKRTLLTGGFLAKNSYYERKKESQLLSRGTFYQDDA